MKRLLLTITAGCFVAFSAFPQTFTDGETGYTIDFTGATAESTCLISCCGDNHNGGLAFADATGTGISTAAGAVDGSDKFLHIVADPTVDITGAPAYFDIYYTNTNCVDMDDDAVAIDMSANGKVTIEARSNTAGAIMRFYLVNSTNAFPAAGSSTYQTDAGDNTKNVIWEITLTTTFQEYTYDFATDADWVAWSGKSDINMYGVVVGNANAEYDIASIKLGSDADVSSVKSAQLPSSVKLYPNPSSDILKVDLSSLNLTNANLKLMNANGSIVKEESNVSNISVAELNSGLYFLQINEYKPVKVIVQ